NALDAPAQEFEVLQALNLHDQVDLGPAVPAAAGPGQLDVGAGLGHRPGHVAQQPRPVQGLDHHLDGVLGHFHPVPRHFHRPGRPFRLDEMAQVGAVAVVDGHAPPPGDVPHDGVAGHRVAAAGQAYQHVVDALDVDPLGAGGGLDLAVPHQFFNVV